MTTDQVAEIPGLLMLPSASVCLADSVCGPKARLVSDIDPVMPLKLVHAPHEPASSLHSIVPPVSLAVKPMVAEVLAV